MGKSKTQIHTGDKARAGDINRAFISKMSQMHECGRGRRKRTIPGSKADCRSCQIEARKVELARTTYDRIAAKKGATFAESKAPQSGPYMVAESPPAAETMKPAAGLLAIFVGLSIFWGCHDTTNNLK